MSHYSDVVVADGGSDLLGYWPLDEASGTEDLSGSDNPAYPGIRRSYGGGMGPVIGGAEGPGVSDSTEFDGISDFVITGLKNRINLVTNPSAETNTTGWTGNNGTLSRDTGKGHTGTCSFKIISTSGSATTRMVSSTIAVTAGQVYTLTARIIGKTGEDIAAIIGWQAGGTPLVNSTTTVAYTGGTDWQTISVTGWAPETATTAVLYLYTLASAGAASDTGWIDAVLFEQSGEFDGYFDGATSRCNWTGTAHGSTSKKGPFVNGLTRTFEWFAHRDTDDRTMSVLGSDAALTTEFMSIAIEADADVVFSPEIAAGPFGFWGTADWPTGRWAHGMIVFDESADTSSLYIDGELIGTDTSTGSWHDEPGYLNIGEKGSHFFADPLENQPWDGRIAHVAVYHGDQSALANSHAVLGLSELTARAAPAPWYSAA